MKLVRRLLIAAILMPGAVLAQVFPDKPVKIIVPFTAGGLVDVLARGVGERLSAGWGQPVVVENRPGANTIIAAEATARSPANGYTILMANDPTLSVNQYLYGKLPYDPVKDLVPVVNIAATAGILLVRPSLAGSVKELIELARSRPGQMTYGSYGVGSKAHLDAEEFARLAGVKFNHIPYKGVAEILVAVAAGQVDMVFSGIPPAVQLVNSGKLRALAVSAPARSTVLPTVPTFAEAGVPGYESKSWMGLVVPNGTPQPVIDKIAQDVQRIIVRPDFQEKYITGVGLELVNQNPTQFAEFLKGDRSAYAKQVKAIGAKLD